MENSDAKLQAPQYAEATRRGPTPAQIVDADGESVSILK